MITVTGVGRSGTSLMMQTLKLLGASVMGDEYLKEARTKFGGVHEWANPKGFYEVPNTVLFGLQEKDIEVVRDSCIKLTINALISSFYRSDSLRCLVEDSKIIWCIRNPLESSVSRKTLTHKLGTSKGVQLPWNKSADAKTIYTKYSSMLAFLKSNDTVKDNTIIVDYDDMIENSEREIDIIVQFTQLNPAYDKIERAIQNIDPNLRRTDASTFRWHKREMNWGSMIEELYQEIKESMCQIVAC